jgi:hypothetical protein
MQINTQNRILGPWDKLRGLVPCKALLVETSGGGRSKDVVFDGCLAVKEREISTCLLQGT